MSQQPPTVFIHIPKTAGTSFTALLHENFSGGVASIGNAFKGGGGFDPRRGKGLDELIASVAPDAHVLAGHLPFGLRHELPGDTRYVTFLRDPVERLLSQYYGLREHAEQRPLPGDGSLEAALDAELLFDNLQTRMLSNLVAPFDPVDEWVLEDARDNLRNRLAAFGIVERYDESVVLLARALDLERLLVSIKPDRYRRTGVRPRGSEVPEHVVRAATDASHYDIELYRWAVKLFEKRVSDQRADFQVELAALRAARTGSEVAPPPPADLALEDLWARVVAMRAGHFRAARDRVPQRRRVEEVDAPGDRRPRRRRSREATVARIATLEEALAGARSDLDAIEARLALVDELTEEEAQRLRDEAERAKNHFTAMQERVSRAREKLAELEQAEAAWSGLRVDRLPREVFEQRSVFFDAAPPYTEFLCAQLGSARLLVKTQDRHIGRSLFLKHGRGDIKLLGRCVAMVEALLGEGSVAGRVLVDVGANIGSTTVHALLDGPFARVVAIEPDPDNFETLQLNLLLNGVADRSIAIRAAASSAAGEVSLLVNPERGGKHRVATDADGNGAGHDETEIAVPAVTLDSLAAEGVYDPAQVGLLWVDAEHHEGHILTGASGLIERGVPIVLEWDPAGLDQDASRERIGVALGGHYTHFVDMRPSDLPGEPKFRLRPIDELPGHVHLGRVGDDDHFTDVLVLRLAPDQVPELDLLSALRVPTRQEPEV